MGVSHADDLQYLFTDVWGEEFAMSTADTK